MAEKLKLQAVTDETPIDGIPKPASKFSLDRFKTKGGPSGVTALLNALPVLTLSQSKDFTRLHEDGENYWSPELAFVHVPMKNEKRDSVHLIDDDLAKAHLPPGLIKRHRLALGSKPHNVFFLCVVPTRNTDNSWVNSTLEGCEKAKSQWALVSSQREEGVEGYKITTANNPDAFPPPKWPTQSLEELIERAFKDRVINDLNHPAMARLLGDKPVAS